MASLLVPSVQAGVLSQIPSILIVEKDRKYHKHMLHTCLLHIWKIQQVDRKLKKMRVQFIRPERKQNLVSDFIMALVRTRQRNQCNTNGRLPTPYHPKSAQRLRRLDTTCRGKSVSLFHINCPRHVVMCRKHPTAELHTASLFSPSCKPLKFHSK